MRIESPVIKVAPFFQTVSSSASVISGEPGLVRLFGDVTFMDLLAELELLLSVP